MGQAVDLGFRGWLEQLAGMLTPATVHEQKTHTGLIFSLAPLWFLQQS